MREAGHWPVQSGIFWSENGERRRGAGAPGWRSDMRRSPVPGEAERTSDSGDARDTPGAAEEPSSHLPKRRRPRGASEESSGNATFRTDRRRRRWAPGRSVVNRTALPLGSSQKCHCQALLASDCPQAAARAAGTRACDNRQPRPAVSAGAGCSRPALLPAWGPFERVIEPPGLAQPWPAQPAPPGVGPRPQALLSPCSVPPGSRGQGAGGILSPAETAVRLPTS